MPRAELEAWVSPSPHQYRHCNIHSLTATSTLAWGEIGTHGIKEALTQQQDFHSFHTENHLTLYPQNQQVLERCL